MYVEVNDEGGDRGALGETNPNEAKCNTQTKCTSQSM